LLRVRDEDGQEPQRTLTNHSAIALALHVRLARVREELGANFLSVTGKFAIGSAYLVDSLHPKIVFYFVKFESD
jgi:hypothetical protein